MERQIAQCFRVEEGKGRELHIALHIYVLRVLVSFERGAGRVTHILPRHQSTVSWVGALDYSTEDAARIGC